MRSRSGRWIGRVIRALSCLAALSIYSTVGAQTSGVSMPQAYTNQAAVSNIPPPVLYTIALMESGRSLPNKVFRPWPWTLNIKPKGADQAKGYFFETREQATDKLLSVLAEDENAQVDIGLMQVNWRYHKARFPSAADALDPYINLRVGASIFSDYWKETNNLWDAIGRYHSKTPKYSQAYKERFGDRLVKLLASGGA